MPEPANHVRDAHEGAYAARAVLDPNTLDSIREANLGFLGIVTARADGGSRLGLEVGAMRQLRTLDAVARAAVAGCPYTLYNLRFEDAAFWRGCAGEVGPPPLGSVAEEASFARTAVFLAWHLAQSNDLAAALVLGMTTDVQRIWRGLPLSALERVAVAALPHLAARFGRHPTFWPKLLAAAGPDACGPADAVRLLGLQLLAADGPWAAARGSAARPAG